MHHYQRGLSVVVRGRPALRGGSTSVSTRGFAGAPPRLESRMGPPSTHTNLFSHFDVCCELSPNGVQRPMSHWPSRCNGAPFRRRKGPIEAVTRGCGMLHNDESWPGPLRCCAVGLVVEGHGARSAVRIFMGKAGSATVHSRGMPARRIDMKQGPLREFK